VTAPAGSPARGRPRRWGSRAAHVAALVLSAAVGPAAAEYTGPLIDVHSHVPNGTAIDAYVAAMKRHNVARVVLLGVGGVQKDDPAWIAAAARKYPDRVVPGVPLPDPTGDAAAARLDAELGRGGPRPVGEAHVRQVSRRIDRSPADPAFLKILEVAGRHRAPVVIHCELDDGATAALEKALAAQRQAVVVLAHAGAAPPGRVEGLLARHPNLRVDLSGMHFQRSPRLATEAGPLDPAWKALIEKHPDRFLIGIDVWAPRLLEPAMLDRLMRWTRRVLGELKPEVAERVAHGNAAALLGLK
jgi:predicted TIM-barrel fold metal-dependent hydrolase